MEVYHINNQGDGGLSVSVEVPNSDTSLSWQTNEVQIWSTSLVNDP